MKKIIILAIATVAAVAMSSCASKPQQPVYQEQTTTGAYGYSK
jgi:uncharacterized protein YcfL